MGVRAEKACTCARIYAVKIVNLTGALRECGKDRQGVRSFLAERETA